MSLVAAAFEQRERERLSALASMVKHKERVKKPRGRRKRRPYCPRGHKKDYVTPSGKLECKLCRYEAVLRFRRKLA